MEHAEAIRMKAAEQYLLGELTGEVREQYEEHFFSCQECAEEVKVGVAFVGGVREVLGSERSSRVAPLPAKMGIQDWFAMLLRPAFALPALAMLLAIVSYQNMVLIPRMQTTASQTNAARTLTSLSLITENSRGGTPSTFVVPPNRPFGLFLDIPPGDFSSYVCEVESESGHSEISLKVSQQEARETVQLLIPPTRLGQGKHFLIVRGLGGSQGNSGGGVEVARYSFTLNFEK